MCHPHAFSRGTRPNAHKEHVLVELSKPLAVMERLVRHTAQPFGPVSAGLAVGHRIAIRVSSFQELTDIGVSRLRLTAFFVGWKPRPCGDTRQPLVTFPRSKRLFAPIQHDRVHLHVQAGPRSNLAE